MGHNLPTLVSTIQGNLYEITAFTGLKLMNLELPPSFAQRFRGPKFGVAGCRKLTKVEGRPLHRHDHQAEHRHVAAADRRHGESSL